MRSATLGKLTYQQKAEIKMLCERRLQEYVKEKGLNIWGYRLLDTEPVPDSLRYRVLKASGGCCAFCGAMRSERPLEVDHIIPRSRGGKTLEGNLQMLCSKCNQTKGNEDDTDFRQTGERIRKPDSSKSLVPGYQGAAGWLELYNPAAPC